MLNLFSKTLPTLFYNFEIQTVHINSVLSYCYRYPLHARCLYYLYKYCTDCNQNYYSVFILFNMWTSNLLNQFKVIFDSMHYQLIYRKDLFCCSSWCRREDWLGVRNRHGEASDETLRHPGYPSLLEPGLWLLATVQGRRPFHTHQLQGQVSDGLSFSNPILVGKVDVVANSFPCSTYLASSFKIDYHCFLIVYLN